MKLSAIMLFVFASMAFAAKGYSQSVRVTLNVNNSSLQKVLDEIEKQSRVDTSPSCMSSISCRKAGRS